MKFQEYRPAFVIGFENKVYEVSDLEDVFKIDFVKRFSEDIKFHCFAISTSKWSEQIALMALYDFNEAVEKCSVWFMVGNLIGFEKDCLPESNTLTYDKKEFGKCFQKSLS